MPACMFSENICKLYVIALQIQVTVLESPGFRDRKPLLSHCNNFIKEFILISIELLFFKLFYSSLKRIKSLSHIKLQFRGTDSF